MDMSHLPEQVRKDLEGIGEFANRVMAAYMDGIPIAQVKKFVTDMKSNSTLFLEGIVDDIYAIDLSQDTVPNVYNMAWNKYMEFIKNDPTLAKWFVSATNDSAIDDAVRGVAWGAR